MRKKEFAGIFKKAIAEHARYIGVGIQTEGSSRPEIIINQTENFEEKLKYYRAAYDEDLILESAKGKKEIRIVAIAAGDSFADIERDTSHHHDSGIQGTGESGDRKNGADTGRGKGGRKWRTGAPLDYSRQVLETVQAGGERFRTDGVKPVSFGRTESTGAKAGKQVCEVRKIVYGETH